MVVRPRTRQNMCVQNDSSNCAFFSSSKSRKWKRSRSRGPLSATTNYMAPRWCMAARASGMIEYLLHRTTVGPTANQHRVLKTHGCPQTIKDALRQKLPSAAMHLLSSADSHAFSRLCVGWLATASAFGCLSKVSSFCRNASFIFSALTGRPCSL